MKVSKWIIFGLLLAVLSSCAWIGENTPLAALQAKKSAWQSPLLRQHHLVGRIWRPADGRFVDEKALMEDLAGSGFVLLGEKHDNPDHHLLQARVISALVRQGRRPAVVWEMIPEPRQPVLDRYWATYSRDAEALGGALGWESSGWPDWNMYKPIAEAAMAARLPMYAAGLPKAAVRALARGKPSRAFAKRRRALGLDFPLPEELRRRSLEQLFQGHCKLMPRQALAPLLTVQRARDAVMAERMLASGVKDGAVLIGGTGHVRKDFAVPLYLRRFQPEVRVTTVGFVEVQEGEVDPAAYAESYSTSVPPFDYVWFTPQANDKDNCAKLKARLKKSGKTNMGAPGRSGATPAVPAKPADPAPAKTPPKS